MTSPDDAATEHLRELGPISYTFSPTLASIRLARHVLANWLELLPDVDVDGVDDLLIAASELVTNAVRHARGAAAVVTLRARSEGDAVIVEIEDDGDGFAWPVAHVLADVAAHDENWRGLFIVEALTDDLEVCNAPGRTIVRCTKRGLLRHAPTSDDPGLSARFRAESHPGDSNLASR